MSSEAPADIYVLAAQLNFAADRASNAAEALRLATIEFLAIRKELQEILRESRRPPEPWRALNMN